MLALQVPDSVLVIETVLNRLNDQVASFGKTQVLASASENNDIAPAFTDMLNSTAELVMVMFLQLFVYILPFLMIFWIVRLLFRTPSPPRAVYQKSAKVSALPPVLTQRLPEPAPLDQRTTNIRDVLGWQFATERELRKLSPEKLQVIVDGRSPWADRIAEVKHRLGEPELATDSPGVRKTRAALEARLKRLRLAQATVREESAQAEAESLIATIDRELKHAGPAEDVPEPKALPRGRTGMKPDDWAQFRAATVAALAARAGTSVAATIARRDHNRVRK